MREFPHDSRTTPARVVGEESDGPRAVYVHGSGSTHQVWGHQYGPDRPIEYAAVLDLAGRGEAPDIDAADLDTFDAGAAGAVLDAYVADVTTVANELDADVLVGNSLGGAVVLQAVLEGRVDPAGLVLAGTGAKLAVREDLRDLLASDFEAAIDVLHGPDMLFHDSDPNVEAGSRASMRAVGQRILRRDLLTAHHFDVRDRLGEIDVPALAVVGEYDSLTPPAYHEYLAAEMPDCAYREIADAAHVAMVERPAAFDGAVAGFADGLPVD